MEKLEDVVKALPHMSKTIVDDTIHEKVLSYLSKHAAKGSDMVNTFLDFKAMDVIRVSSVT
jgi:hypothetical protein